MPSQRLDQLPISRRQGAPGSLDRYFQQPVSGNSEYIEFIDLMTNAKAHSIPVIKTRSTAAAPTGGSKVRGEISFVPDSATGAWAGNDGRLAGAVGDTDSEWAYLTPFDGMLVFMEEDGHFYYWDSSLAGTDKFTGRAKLVDDATTPPLNVTARSAPPTTPLLDDIYMDDGTNTASGDVGWRRYNGSAWEDVSGETGGGINAQNGGVDVSGGPFQKVNLVNGGASDGGAGVLDVTISGGGGGGSGMSPVARRSMSANVTALNLTTDTDIGSYFDTSDFDDGSNWSSDRWNFTSTARPIIGLAVDLDSIGNDDRIQLSFNHYNSSDVLQKKYRCVDLSNGSRDRFFLPVYSPPIPVVNGDYITVSARVFTDTSITIDSLNSFTFLFL